MLLLHLLLSSTAAAAGNASCCMCLSRCALQLPGHGLFCLAAGVPHLHHGARAAEAIHGHPLTNFKRPRFLIKGAWTQACFLYGTNATLTWQLVDHSD